jgi:hypothetical protein
MVLMLFILSANAKCDAMVGSEWKESKGVRELMHLQFIDCLNELDSRADNEMPSILLNHLDIVS